MLIVEGNLTLRSGVDFTGVVLVRGAVIGGPGGGRVTGTMSIAGQGCDTVITRGHLDRILAMRGTQGLAWYRDADCPR